MVSRSKSIDGLIILRDFDFAKITRRQSEDLRKEFARSEMARLQTIIKYGTDEEKLEARRLLRAMQSKQTTGKRKRGDGDGNGDDRRKR